MISLTGIATWFAHGTCTQLAQLFPPGAMVQVQLGLQLSNIIALVIVLAMRVTQHDINDDQIAYFFYLVAVFVLVLGLCSWLAFLQRSAETEYLLSHRNSTIIAAQAEGGQPISGTEHASLLKLEPLELDRVPAPFLVSLLINV